MKNGKNIVFSLPIIPSRSNELLPIINSLCMTVSVTKSTVTIAISCFIFLLHILVLKLDPTRYPCLTENKFANKRHSIKLDIKIQRKQSQNKTGVR